MSTLHEEMTTAPITMELPTPGSEQYISTLIRTLLENPALEEWQFDPNVFLLLFLALIVRRGGLILDVPRDGARNRDRHMPMNSVVGIAQSIFGLDTRCVHLDPSIPPSKVIKLIQSCKAGSRIRNRRNRRAGSRSQDDFPTRPMLSVVTQPESGVATRYHSAETQLAASRRNSYLAQAENSGQAVDTGEWDNGSVLGVGEEGNTGTEKKEGWPDVLVVTGLEDCESPLQIQICDLVKQSRGEREDGNPIMVIWIRNEDKADRAPAWLVDNFVLSCTLDPTESEAPPVYMPRQALIPPSYIRDLSSLLPFTHIHPSLTQNLNNLISATSTHPHLHSAMTGNFFITLPTLVKAHRLLSTPYYLPPDWRENLAKISSPDRKQQHQFGLGGGLGGVDDWPRKAGEEPNMADLGEGCEAWFVGPANVRGVWASAVRHRVRWREASESIMWAIKSSAADLGGRPMLSDSKLRRKARKRREEVERILDEMLDIM